MPNLLSAPVESKYVSGARRNPDAETANTLFKRHEYVCQLRSPWENRWQSIKDLVRPSTQDFRGNTTRGSEDNLEIFDGTAPWALDQFASGIGSQTTPQTERWFGFRIMDEELMRDPQVLAWLEYVSDLIYAVYSDDSVNFVPTMHEADLDLGAFGTAVIFQDWNVKKDSIRFRAFPLAACWVLENDDGEIDTLHRETKMTARNAMRRFGADTPPKISEAAAENPEKEYTFIHIVMPNEDTTLLGITKQNMAFASYWLCKDTKELCGRGGYKSFPYAVPRWKKMAGDTYGTSPAMVCLPDIRTLNEYEQLALEATQLIVAPPVMVPSDGFFGLQPNKDNTVDISPRALMYYEHEEALPRPYREEINLRLTDEKMQQKREFILNCFFADVMRYFRKAERQTAQEVLELRDERLRTLGPIIARSQNEKCGPMLKRTFNLLNERNFIPPNPPQMDGYKLEIEYISNAAMAQMRSKSQNVSRWLTGTVAPLAQVDPTVMDIIDTDKVASESAIHEGVSRRVLRTPKEIQQRRDARSQQQQMAQSAELGGQVASAVKDLSTAGKNFPQLLGIPGA